MLINTEKTVVQLTIDDYKTATILQFQASKWINAWLCTETDSKHKLKEDGG